MDFDLTSSKEINSLKQGDNCTVTLQVKTYFYKPGNKRLFINCQAKDGFAVVCVGWQNARDNDYKSSSGDIIKLNNVKIGKERKAVNNVNWDLQLEKSSKVHLLHSASGEYNTPIEILCPISVTSNCDDESLKSGYTYQLTSPTSEEKVVGVIQDHLVEEHFSELTGSYYTTNIMLLKDSTKLKLIISPDIGYWPKFFFNPGHNVSVGGEEWNYHSNMKARVINKGDHLDIATPQEIEAALAKPKAGILKGSGAGFMKRSPSTNSVRFH